MYIMPNKKKKSKNIKKAEVYFCLIISHSKKKSLIVCFEVTFISIAYTIIKWNFHWIK